MGDVNGSALTSHPPHPPPTPRWLSLLPDHNVITQLVLVKLVEYLKCFNKVILSDNFDHRQFSFILNLILNICGRRARSDIRAKKQSEL